MAALLGPTGGFLIAFPLAAAAVSAVYRGLGGPDSSGGLWVAKAAASVLVGEIVIYAVGVPWLMVQTGMTFSQAITVALVPFLIPDAIKALIAIVIAKALNRASGR
jgi:biotin transport system substrate-specific component